MDAVLAEDRGAACGHPHSGQCVAVNLVLLDHALAFLMLEHNRGAGEDLRRATCGKRGVFTTEACIYHIDAPVLPVVDLVVPYNGAAVGSDLDSRQGVTVDIVTLYQTPPISKYVHSSLVTIKYGVSPGYKK